MPGRVRRDADDDSGVVTESVALTSITMASAVTVNG
jgi:hypothetical protein